MYLFLTHCLSITWIGISNVSLHTSPCGYETCTNEYRGLSVGRRVEPMAVLDHLHIDEHILILAWRPDIAHAEIVKKEQITQSEQED